MATAKTDETKPTASADDLDAQMIDAEVFRAEAERRGYITPAQIAQPDSWNNVKKKEGNRVKVSLGKESLDVLEQDVPFFQAIGYQA